MPEIRNAKYNQFGTIDLEFNHPSFGWIPSTVQDGSGEDQMQEIYDLAMTGMVAPFAAPPIAKGEVTAERDRRLVAGFSFDIDGVSHVFDSDDQSMKRITGAATLAGFAIAHGAQAGDLFWHGGAIPFGWITKDNSVVQMDAQTTFALGQRAANWESEHIFAAQALKNMSEIPEDYADAKHWPAIPA